MGGGMLATNLPNASARQRPDFQRDAAARAALHALQPRLRRYGAAQRKQL
jgi:hypothetical protein